MDHSTPKTVTGFWAELKPGELYRPPRKPGEWVDGNSVIRRVEQRVVQKLPGRNDPCHCGSGKKFKKCCLGKDA